MELYFDKGTLVLKDCPEWLKEQIPQIQWDSRVQQDRAPAIYYRAIVLALHQKKVSFQDHAIQFEPQSFDFQKPLKLRTYQEEASQAWMKQGKMGVVTLPTGAGKTILAVSLIQQTQRPALVHVPTIDLMHQWHSVLKSFLDTPIGLLGGGYHEIHSVTVATYDSALLHVNTYGSKFGLLVFDECHHLPGSQYQYAAVSSIAPFRLGLTATPERSDGKEEWLYQICGPLCYQIQINELEGKTLAQYDVVTKEVEMTPEELEEYENTRQTYLDFVKQERINFSDANGWNTFLWKCSRTPRGRDAFKAYRRQKQLSQASSAKEAVVWELIQDHASERIILFTQDNEMAYRLGKLFFLPVLTHHTKVKEREHFLESFRQGDYSVLVTSKVLNEGVDVPEASVAIVVSGSGSIREHVQRLGRVLRPQPGKRAVLYEIISKGTGEYFINQRRRQHNAYQRSPSLPQL